MTLELTDAAIGDLRSIRDYTLEKWGEEQEEIYLSEMWDRFEEIQSNSGRHRFRHDLFPNCQIATQGKHVILFRSEGEILQIVRVLHSAMDFGRHIPKDL
jgi:toxin ParE1/3/4